MDIVFRRIVSNTDSKLYAQYEKSGTNIWSGKSKGIFWICTRLGISDYAFVIDPPPPEESIQSNTFIHNYGEKKVDFLSIFWSKFDLIFLL